MQERLEWIDRIKGFAILLVVIGHVYIFSFGVTDTLVYKVIASFHMHLFMFISEFVAYVSPEVKDVYKKVLKRICSYVCPAYLIGFVISAYLQIVPVEVEYVHFNGYWYLKSLAIFCVIQLLLLRCKRILIEIIIVLVILSLFYFGWRCSPLLSEMLCLEHNVLFYPFFLCGYYVKRFNLIDALLHSNWLFTIGLLGYFFFSALCFPNDLITELTQRYLAPLMAVIAIVYYFSNVKSTRINKYLEYLGGRTLDIYLYHYLFIINFSMLNIKELCMSLFSSDNTFIAFFLSLLVSVILIHLSVFVGDFLKTSVVIRKVIYGQIMK